MLGIDSPFCTRIHMLLKPVGVVAHRVDASLELLALAAELRQQPADDDFGIRPAHVDVVQAEQFRILHHLDLACPTGLRRSRA